MKTSGRYDKYLFCAKYKVREVHTVKAKIEEISIDTHQLHYIPLHHFTIVIIFDTVLIGRNEFENAKDNEFNSAAISLLWHPPPVLCRGQFNVASIRRR